MAATRARPIHSIPGPPPPHLPSATPQILHRSGGRAPGLPPPSGGRVPPATRPPAAPGAGRATADERSKARDIAERYWIAERRWAAWTGGKEEVWFRIRRVASSGTLPQSMSRFCPQSQAESCLRTTLFQFVSVLLFNCLARRKPLIVS